MESKNSLELDDPGRAKENKSILSLTALFESDFSIDWIVELTNSKVSQVITTLEDGVRHETLIHRGSGIYFFNKEKEQKKLVDCLDKQVKATYHMQIAQILQKELPENEKKAVVLSNHLLHIPTTLEQSKYLISAGDYSLKRFKTQKAFQCYSKVLDSLSLCTGKEADIIFSVTAIKFSKVSIARQDTGKVVKILKEALARSKRLKDISSEALLEMHLAKNEWLMGKYTSAMNHFDKGWLISSETDDPNLIRSASVFVTFFFYWQGRFKEAVENYEKSVSDVEKHPKGRFPLLATITSGYCYSQIGQITQGLGMIDAVRSLCLEREDSNIAAYTTGNMGCIMLDIHQVDDAISNIKTAIREASKTNNKWVKITGQLILAYSYNLKGDNDRCIRHFRDFLHQREKVRTLVSLYPYIMELLWLIEQEKLPSVPGYSLEKEVARCIREKNIFMKGVAYRYQALLQKCSHEPAKKILRSLENSIKWLEMSGHQFQLAETQLELARMYLKAGDEPKAKEYVGIASNCLASFNDDLIPDDLRCLIDKEPVNEKLFKKVLELGQKIADVIYSKDLIGQVLSSVNRMTGAERCALFLLSEEYGKPKFRLRASKNLTSAQINHPDFSSSLKLLEKVALTGKGMIVESSSDEENAFFSNENICSRICVPMILRGKVVGVMYNDNRLLTSAFKESDLDLLAFFAAQAAFAIDNAKAYSEIKQLNRRLSQEKEYYKEEHSQKLKSDDIIGVSPGMKNVLSQVEQVAKTEATALILGQTGVGKELIARAIHNQSSRRDKPFISVNCAALPESLITSELFGHEKGAFTGANHRRIGRFELADGGTLFLDEIGDIPSDVQVRLLRVLQTHEFERVGGAETMQSDFRLITATNKDLEQEVKEKRFRVDLFYRLNVFPLCVPPLRERIEDIPLLSHHFLNIYAAKMKKTFSGISEEEMEKLMKYNWPGNVRELENVIERGTILSREPNFRTPELRTEANSADHDNDDLSLQHVEKQHILWVLNKTNWKIRGPGGAAELLEIHPSTLHFRMKKMGIQK